MASAITEKLNPPIIEGTLPAFYKETNGTATLTVPFAMNRAVSKNIVTGFVIKIKTIQSNTYLGTIDCLDPILALNNLQANFLLNSSLLNRILPGQFLKVQLAYKDANGTTGYFSTVGIVKYTTKPSVSIVGAAATESNEIPSFKKTYTGLYTQGTGDTSEKAYEYIFNLYDSKKSLVQTSGWQLHDSSTDITDSITTMSDSNDQWTFDSTLTPYQSYYLEYGVRTINGLVVYSRHYVTMNIEGITPDMRANVVATNIADQGYVKLTLEPWTLRDNQTRGSYVIMRTSADTNYSLWEEIYRVVFFASNLLTEWFFKDFTVQQGKYYRYALQQYNDAGLYSSKLESNIIMADFEDMFLYDGERQLRIRFNPKVTSFKIDRLEQKIDTIGSKFPFIFRNGRVEYREFPISGLISYIADDNHDFITYKELGLVEDTQFRTRTATDKYTNKNIPTHNLVGYNFYAEREFKMAVLEWLGNGKPKLFKSPGEGNFIVRLMNISLAPEDKVSRMLHTFSATAYEIAENSYANAVSLGFIDTGNPDKQYYSYETVQLVDSYGYFLHGKINKHAIAGYIYIENMVPGTFILSGNDALDDDLKEKWVIGPNGSLRIDLGDKTLNDIYISSEKDEYGRFLYNFQGQVTYRYLSKMANTFNLIKEIKIKNEVRTFTDTYSINILDTLNQNIKKEVFLFYYLNLYKKDRREIWTKRVNNTLYYYLDEDCTIPVKQFESTVIYSIHIQSQDAAGNLVERINYFTGDGSETPLGPLPLISDSCTINGHTFTEEPIITFPMGQYTEIKVGNGYVCDCAYQVKEVEYEIESTDATLQNLARSYGTDSYQYLNHLEQKIIELQKEMEGE